MESTHIPSHRSGRVNVDKRANSAKTEVTNWQQLAQSVKKNCDSEEDAALSESIKDMQLGQLRSLLVSLENTNWMFEK